MEVRLDALHELAALRAAHAGKKEFDPPGRSITVNDQGDVVPNRPFGRIKAKRVDALCKAERLLDQRAETCRLLLALAHQAVASGESVGVRKDMVERGTTTAASDHLEVDQVAAKTCGLTAPVQQKHDEQNRGGMAHKQRRTRVVLWWLGPMRKPSKLISDSRPRHGFRAWRQVAAREGDVALASAPLLAAGIAKAARAFGGKSRAGRRAPPSHRRTSGSDAR